MIIEARFRFRRGKFSLDVDLTVPGQGVTAIFGPSGCGKTSLLRVIAGLEYVTDGYLKVGEQVWQDETMFLPSHKRPLGYVFQEPSLFPHLNVQRNLEYGLNRLRRQERKVPLDRAIELLGIGHLLQRGAHQLSGGEQQRVAIARALAVSPAMLLLDEPLAALDQKLKHEILPYLETLHRELQIPVLYVSHSRTEIARLADYMILLEEGTAQATGTVSELFSRLDLSLAHGPDTETVIESVVTAYDEHYNLAHLDFDKGTFIVASSPVAVGKRVRIQVRARDVSLTLARQEKTSILNIFSAVVEQISEEGTAQVTVMLSVGSAHLLSRITRKSAQELGLKPGLELFAQVKSVALLV